ncbi:chemotaxis-specific protein-glutamate methyltransferase CheB [Phenylobacterium sp.]|uniref:chemotaxis-specific protein-glutamate methyltransferase CheB n=1 Tax=Phenylobacterium sp. TaxID=1871053 RepID=UPI0035B0C27B
MTRLLVVDDSALVRRLLGELFEAEEGFEVAYARNGLEALDALQSFRPDVITLDVQMPQMDGLTCLDRIMVERPTPVVMVSSLTEAGAAETLKALALGAVDVIAKPSGPISLEIDTLGPLLVEKIRAAAGARIRRTHRLAERVRTLAGAAATAPRPARQPGKAAATRAAIGVPAPGEPAGLVLVGCSTGGPPALDALLSPLPADFPWPLRVAQHMPRAFTGPLARRLDGLCALKVVEVTQPVRIEKGHVYIGRGDADLIVSARPDGVFALSAPASQEHRWHPSVDRMVESALAAFPSERLAGVLMTGMGDDGAASLARVRAGGGLTLAEAEETAVVWGMPGELVRAGGASVVAPLELLAQRLVEGLAA